jgi:superfamily I DNA/RNA helicase
LLDGTFTDADENVEKRNDTVSVFNGPAPIIQTVKNAGEETEWVSQWLAERSKAGILPHEMGVFVRSNEELLRAKAAVEASGMPSNVLDEDMETVTGRVSVGTMHLAKGLEFRAVVVMACDDDVIPMQSRLEEVGDMGDMDEVYDTERQLLYVACTRARDDLLVTAIAPGSEFLVDLTGAVGKRPAM